MNAKLRARRARLWKQVWHHRWLYLFLVPAIVGLFVFNYLPMLGNIVAFKNYSFRKGIFGSPWAGLKYFEKFLNYYQFDFIIKNTLKISLLKIFLCFPVPIIFALLLNEISCTKYKKTVQSLSYLPHFVSWVIVITLFSVLLNPNNGLLNEFMIKLGLIDKPIYFFGEEKWFYSLVWITDIFKNMGWSSIIYLAALSGVNQELYEAAAIDGANRFQRTTNVTIPAIIPTIVLMFILQFRGILSSGFDQIFLMQTPGNFNVSETLDIFIFRQGLLNFNISYSTAVGLMTSVLTLGIVYVVNTLSARLTNQSLW